MHKSYSFRFVSKHDFTGLINDYLLKENEQVKESNVDELKVILRR